MSLPSVTHPEWIGKTPERDILWKALEGIDLKETHSGLILKVMEEVFLGGQSIAEADSAIQQMFQTHARVNYAGWLWDQSGGPLLRMSEDLATSLLNTRPLEGHVAELPHMPWNCFYVTIPEHLFHVWNEDSGLHPIEGIYILKDRVWSKAQEKVMRAVHIIVVGKDKLKGSSPLRRDDAIGYLTIIEGSDLHLGGEGSIKGIREGQKVAWNFLILWNSLAKGQISMQKVTPKVKDVKGRGRRQRRAAEKLARKSTAPFFRLGFKSTGAPKPRSPGAAPTGPLHKVLIHGFFRRHWLLVSNIPKGVQATGTRKSSSGKPMASVVKFIEPHWGDRRGAKKSSKEYRV